MFGQSSRAALVRCIYVTAADGDFEDALDRDAGLVEPSRPVRL